ncbi:hypothetical protein HZA86_00145 [Candidatus Uhrbacteria bacterium]|nr:hypothetical protein [Candidatus Uhrbacteria bacterium]
MPGFCSRCGQSDDDIYNHVCAPKSRRKYRNGTLDIVDTNKNQDEKDGKGSDDESTPPVTNELEERYPHLR